MATIFTDSLDSMSNVFVANNFQDVIFRWLYFTTSGEEQSMAQVRWRKANTFASALERMNVADSAYSAVIEVNRLEDMTTWSLSGGQMVPPAAGSRRYTEPRHVTFPINTFSDGVWIIQMRYKNVGQESGDWSAWVTHRIEVSQHNDRAVVSGTGVTATKQAFFPTEGVYSVKVQTMSEAGILSADSSEISFNVWDTNKFYSSGGVVSAVPEYTILNGQVLRLRK